MVTPGCRSVEEQFGWHGLGRAAGFNGAQGGRRRAEGRVGGRALFIAFVHRSTLFIALVHRCNP